METNIPILGIVVTPPHFLRKGWTLALLFVFSTSIQFTESRELWKPVKGDSKSGPMPGLLNPLGSSEWYPNECRRIPMLADIELDRRKLLSSKERSKRRIAGWKSGMFHDAELVLDSWLALLDLNGTCAFEVQQCCSPKSQRFRRVSHKHAGVLFQYSETPDSELACKSQISIPKRSWGSCAFIASGATLLRQTWGKFIDKHDTIIRLGHMPLKDWEEYTGLRTDVLIGRGTIQSKFAQSEEKNLKFLIGKDSTPNLRVSEKIQVSDSTVIKPTRDHHKAKLILGDPRVADILYDISTIPLHGKSRGPTTGFTHVLRIILSQFCEEVNVFGLSPNCGGHYYNLKSQMKSHHSCELESWVLHYIMKNAYKKAKMCVFV